MKTKPTIYLCDDGEEIRKALQFLLRQNGFEQFDVRPFASGQELLDSIENEPKPLRAIFVLDLNNLPMAGNVLHDHLIERGYTKRSPVIFLSGSGLITAAVVAIKKGALDFVEKPDVKGLLIPLLHRAVELESQWSAQADRCGELKAKWDSLSHQEQKVAVLVAQGFLNKQIAVEMNIGARLLEIHRIRALGKLRARKPSEIAIIIAEMKACGIDVAGDAK